MSSGIKGLDQLADVIDLIKNPDLYEERLNKIKEATAEYKKVVEAVVELSKVNDYVKSLEDRDAETKNILASAKKEASSIIENAKQEASEIRIKVKKQEEKSNERERDLSSREGTIRADQEKTIKLRRSLEEQVKEHQAKTIELDRLSKELEEKRNKLLAAMG